MNEVTRTFQHAGRQKNGGASGPSDTKVREQLPAWIPALVSFAIVSGIVLCGFVVWQGYQNKSMQPAIFLLVLFLLLFALGTLTAMLFVTNEKFDANIAGFSLMIGGPAALWFGGTLLIAFTPLYKQLFNPFAWPDTVPKLERTILDIEQRMGWKLYDQWKVDNLRFAQQVVYGERGLLSELLENAFAFPNPMDPNEEKFQNVRNLLKSPRIVTAFLYFPEFAVKLQAISGDIEDGAPKAELFFANRASNGSDPRKGLFFADVDSAGTPTKINAGIIETNVVPDNFGWEVTRNPKVRSLMVARYDDGSSSKQDRLVVDMKKFTRNAGTIDLAALNYEYPMDPSSIMWRMRGSSGGSRGQVPLVFRRSDIGSLASLHAPYSDQPVGSAEDDPRYAAKVQQALVPWMKLVDEYVKRPFKPGEQPPADRQFLVNVRDEIASVLTKKLGFVLEQPITFEKLLAVKPKGASAFHVESAEDVNIVLIKPRT